ncbi:MAG TPA: hypothetical protein PKU90_00870 [Candidatus Paceibacterota bacterium]|nr:hypothetical protein [Candidatus Paceibacterota bacterium]HQM34823.1 hypothetical protein [Candidatus Paceibacterota bacterium]
MAEFKTEQPNFNPQQLEEISQKVQERLGEQKEVLEKREVVREVVEKKINQAMPTTQTATPITDDGVSLKLSEIKKIPEEERIKAIVRVALQDSIADAVKIAQKLGPYYVDGLHDTLVDEFLNILIQQKKI